MSTKRKHRNKIMKTKPDLNIPINIEILGTDDDPCFAKLFDPREDECKRCGDAEICVIAMGQKNHIARLQMEKKGNFKDLEELEIKPKQTEKEIRKQIKNRARGMIKMGGGNYVDMGIIIDDVFASFGKDNFTKIRIEKIINKMVENSSFIIKKQNKLKWKKTAP